MGTVILIVVLIVPFDGDHSLGQLRRLLISDAEAPDNELPSGITAG